MVGTPATEPDVVAPASNLVTICFTDIEDSTPVLERMPEAYPDLIATHNQLLRAALGRHGGTELGTEGDSFFVSFPSAVEAVLATIEMQRALSNHDWPSGGSLRVRIGLHTGSPVRTSEGYIGIDIHRAARVKSAAHGGQVLISGATHELAAGLLPPEVEFNDLGMHRLKGLSQAERLFQVVAPGLPRHFPPPNTARERPGTLPVQPTSMLGRESELRELVQLLSRHDLRLITVTGPGGAGKTRLAIEAASVTALNFSRGAVFVPLAAAASPASVIGAMARALEVTATDRGLDAVIEYLRDQQALLVLDNFEHVLGAAGDIASLLAECPRMKVLATSREPLHVRGEVEFPVATLRLPASTHASFVEAAASPAVQLFAERAASVHPGFALTPENAADVAQICIRCDGLPLAIELVAARSRLLPPGALLARLTNPLGLASHGARDLPERQQSLRGTIAWSYDLLPPPQQLLFRHLAVFRGGFTLDAAEAVLPGGSEGVSLLDDLEALIAKNFVSIADRPGASRFSMLEIIREFGLEQLGLKGELAESHTRHLDYFRAWTVRSSARGDQGAHVGALDAESDNLRAALEWSLTSAELARRGMSLAVAGGMYFWQNAGMDGAEWLSRLLEAATDAPRPLRARALYWLAFLRMQSRQPQEVAAIAEECVALTGDGRETSPTRIMALNILGEALIYVGEYSRAADTCAAAVSAARASGDPRLIGLTLFPAGIVALRRTDPLAARKAWEESCAHFRSVCDGLLLTTPLCALAALELNAGDHRMANALLAECVRSAAGPRDAPQLAQVLPLLGRLHLARGAEAEAEACFRQALEAVIACRFAPRIGQSLLGTAEMCAQRGQWSSAVVLAEAVELLGNGPDSPDTDPVAAGRIKALALPKMSVSTARSAIEQGARLTRSEAVAYALRAMTDRDREGVRDA